MGLARDTAAEAGVIARRHIGAVSVERKADESVVTEADRAMQDVILKAVGTAYPDHAVLAEETLAHTQRHAPLGDARYTWVVDPLDGTRNYAAGFPCYSTSIAVLDRGVPVVALVMEHNVSQTYTAIRHQGTECNGRRVSMEEPQPGMDVLVGVPSSKDPLAVTVVSHWVSSRGIICRNFGSTAFALALTSSGGLDAAFAKRAKIWDIAAGMLLVTEAGGRFTDPFGRERDSFRVDDDPEEDLPFLAAPRKLHGRLMTSINTACGQVRHITPQ